MIFIISRDTDQVQLMISLLFFVACLVISHVDSSEGDRSLDFQHCVHGCVQKERAEACRPWDSLPMALKWTLWTCLDDCKYICMHETEAERRLWHPQHKPTAYKYYGKWPFVRVFGIQEISSVIFSALNLSCHVMGLMDLLSHQIDHLFMASVWRLYALAHIMAWASSCVFHTRDTRLTERVDYVLADTVVAMGLICSTCRILSEPQLISTSYRSLAAHLRSLVILVILSALGIHLQHMLTIKFDYGLNMQRCVITGILTSVTWLIWLLVIRGQGHPTATLLLRFIVLAYAALLLEVLDFPPVMGLMDAHALWHLSTIPLTLFFYHFVLGDLTHLQGVLVKKGNHGFAENKHKSIWRAN